MSPVCFGARDNSYGVFNIPITGHVIAFKLVYRSGYVNCDVNNQLNTKWGCTFPAPPNNLAVFITDAQKKRIVPTDNTSFLAYPWCNDKPLFYSLVGISENDSELRFNNFSSPMAVTTGQELQMWFSEDLLDCSEGDNGGQTCADMYGSYV